MGFGIITDERLSAEITQQADDQRFESFVSTFRAIFTRQDQFLRFRTYLRGLIEPSERKNVEAIAAHLASQMTLESNLSQSLQHFLSNSPWNERLLLTKLRQWSFPVRRDAEPMWVVHDGVFVKKGLHSVGVQRQFARALGRKINCQIGVFVGQYTSHGYYPLAARLYLPQAWVREWSGVNRGRIPTQHLQSLTKAQVALQLLEELRAEVTFPPQVIVEEGYRLSDEFLNDSAQRGWQIKEDTSSVLAKALDDFEGMKDRFGLDHFEGRQWIGWHHHVALVFAAQHYTLANNLSPERQ